MYFPFDGSESNSILDHSGINYVFVNNGATWQSTGSSLSSAYYDLDGLANYLDIDDINIDYSNGYSFSTWVKWDNFNSWSRVLDFGNGAASDNIILANRLLTNDLVYEVYNGGVSNGQIVIGSALTAGDWVHIVVTHSDVGSVRIYTDGDLVRTASSGLPNNINRVNNYIGRSNWGADGYFDGNIEDFRFYNRVLSQEEVLGLYSNRVPKYKGEIVISNVHFNQTISDIEVFFDNSSNIGIPFFISGNYGQAIKIDSNNVKLHIPQLESGNKTVFKYYVFSDVINPINFTTGYSVNKVLSGEKFKITDSLKNIFNNMSYQTNQCIYDIKVKQLLMTAGNSSFDSFVFDSGSTLGADAVNVGYSGADLIQDWDVLGGGCLNKGSSVDINYDVIAPLSIDSNDLFNISNSTLSFRLNESISGLRLNKILAIGDGNLTISKKIVKPSHSTLHGTNVTWQANGTFFTDSPLDYVLKSSSLWVSRRNVDGLYTNITKIDVDGIDGSNLKVDYNPNADVNMTQSWTSPNWFFNYSDVPSPITWFNVSFFLKNDGVQLLNKSFLESNNSIYFKQIMVISGYLLEINKNVTSFGVDKYMINVTVFNRGNQITPVDSIVTVYDFIPSNFNLISSINYSSSTWYNTDESNHSIAGSLDGKLIQWGIIPTNAMNSSLNLGPVANSENTWNAVYVIEGQGDYNSMDVFITGLDPQAVEGAGSSKAILIEDNLKEFGLFESISALFSGVLIFVILLL